MIDGVEIVKPIWVKPEELEQFKWAEKLENKPLYWHIRSLCQEHPSVFLAHAASDSSRTSSSKKLGLETHCARLANEFNLLGINAFLPMHAVPLSAFAQAMAKRGAPISIYLSEEKEKIKLTFLGANGGLFDTRDFANQKPKEPTGKLGVTGATKVLEGYIFDISTLADMAAESSAGYKKLQIPFSLIKELIEENSSLGSISEKENGQFSAKISADGQKIKIFDEKNQKIDARAIAETIFSYLKKERFANGSVIGPEAMPGQVAEDEDFVEVFSLEELHYQGAYADLLLGWWEDGTLSHQGCSSFGDALVTALYFMEGVNSGYFNGGQ